VKERPSVLIVDDDDITAETFARSLRLHGFDVRTAANGEEALTVADSHTPDAIITDLHMPLRDGLGFLRQLRERPELRRVPVALLTGDVFLSDATEAGLRACGATIRFKPFWIEDLLELTERLLHDTLRSDIVARPAASHH
jgi:CheY-like chemotaxis protein